MFKINEVKIFPSEELSKPNIKRKNLLHFVICADEYVIYPLGVLIFSILKNNNTDCFFHIFFRGEISQNEESRYRFLCNEYNCVIKVYNLDDYYFKNLQGNKDITVTAFYRLIAPYILHKEEIKKCLYLDTDILCIKDVSNLFKVDLKDKIAYVIKDATSIPKYWDEYCKSIGMKSQKYFNSGVLLIDIDNYLMNDIGIKAIKLASKNDYKYLDQDVLNILLEGKVIFDNENHNNCTMSVQSQQICLDKITLVHFTGTKKPWKKYTCLWGGEYKERGSYEWKYQFYKKWRDYAYLSPWKSCGFELPKKAEEWRYLMKMYYFPQKKYIKGLFAYLKYLKIKTFN